MNYFVTHSDKNYVEVAEKLFESLKWHSNYKILYYTVNFKYKNAFSNVIPIYYETDSELDRINLLFLKSKICNTSLKQGNNNFCYVDADCIAIENCDEIFNDTKKITSYPLLGENCHQYMMSNGKGDPFLSDGGIDLNLCLEAKFLKKLNIPVNKRTSLYRPTNVLLFNNKCHTIMDEWQKICYNGHTIKNWEEFTPFHEETVLNCLLWKDDLCDNLGQVSINIPSVINNRIFVEPKELNNFINAYKNPQDEDVYCGTFCKIPSKKKISNIRFLHGKVSEDQLDYIIKNFNKEDKITQNKNSHYIYLIHSTSLGDTIASTPVLRKLYNSYGCKIDIVTYHSEIFKKNPYVNNVFEFSSFDLAQSSYKEKFESFLGVGGIKNNLGIEKKHNTIDIRQFHAIDLGFMLNDNEMEYDYTPNSYIEINNLPKNYVCLHVANTWPSRTYSDSNWQKLIDILNSKNIHVVLIGKNSHESGFYNIDKPTKKLILELGLDLTNKLDISQCWYVINKSEYFITMDSGLLHLAGTTDTNIIQLGSSINNKLRAPYRNGSQDYKYEYISGPCKIFCASDIKYGVKEWKTIQGVPPLINCLENKNTFECHPDAKEVCNSVKLNLKKSLNPKIEIFNIDKDSTTLFLAPHLSTGGSPAYLKWLIEENIKNNIKPVVIEYCNYGSYEVQKKQIIDLIGKDNFYTFGNHWDSDLEYNLKSPELIKLIDSINPSIIHLNEISEAFSLKNITQSLFDYLYSKDRSFKIVETSHTSEFNFADKKYLPDRFDFCTPYHLEKTKHLNVEKNIVEMTVPNKLRPNRSEKLKKLCLSENYFHVLNVGLFTKDKNQKYLFDLAERLQDKKVMFHFVGNTCYYNDCGITNSQKNLKNNILWDERDDVDAFMSCMDLFAFPSLKELNPISIKEALSWNMPCYINRLETYGAKYDNHPLINYIENDNLFNLLNNIPYV